MSSSNKVVVIGKGRFGNATAQGLREGFIEGCDGKRMQCEVVQVSATTFTNLSVSEMADELQDTAFVAYCGTKLTECAVPLALAIQEATKRSSTALEFIDFSNPDPALEMGDVSGALDLWVALNTQGKDEEVSKKEGSAIKVWKITEVGSFDISGIASNTDGRVYGSHPGQGPNIVIPNLSLTSAPAPSADLFEEARHRIMERASLDCWHDGNIMGLAVFAFTAMYAIVRYDINVNGTEPHSNIPMYILDKAVCWTALWMMVVSPFAGNLLALGSVYQKWSRIHFVQKIVTLFCSLLMVIPTILFSLSWVVWIVARNVFFMSRWPVGKMYLSQSPSHQPTPNMSLVKATLVDMVNLKGETGSVGFAYALIHSFLGFVICDVAYKDYWFDTTTGRLLWNMELSVMTGTLSTVILMAVTMRSIFGKASWVVLKPFYTYLSPIGIWFAIIHIIAFGSKSWSTLFDKDEYKGHMTISFVSSAFAACVLLVHHIMAIFGTKKVCSSDHLWKHSVVNIANAQFHSLITMVGNVRPELLEGTMHLSKPFDSD